LAAIEVSSSDEGRELRAKHQLNAKMVKERLIDAGLPVMDSPSHIVPVMVGDAKAAAEICDRLIQENSIYIQSINYPTVARGEERLRIVPNPHHTNEMIDDLVNSVVGVWRETISKYENSAHKKFKAE
jgi:5-aminolevulinate synthase